MLWHLLIDALSAWVALSADVSNCDGLEIKNLSNLSIGELPCTLRRTMLVRLPQKNYGFPLVF